MAEVVNYGRRAVLVVKCPHCESAISYTGSDIELYHQPELGSGKYIVCPVCDCIIDVHPNTDYTLDEYKVATLMED